MLVSEETIELMVDTSTDHMYPLASIVSEFVFFYSINSVQLSIDYFT